MAFHVYRIVNTLNNKTYVGVSKVPKKRIHAHLSGKGSRLIAEDLEEFGKEAFMSQVLISFPEETAAVQHMQHLLMRQNSLYPNGYNLTIGGKGSHGHMWSMKQRDGISGSNNKNSRLTETDVAAIFWDTRTRREIAKEYGISTTMVTKIKRGRAWKHITKDLMG